MYDGYVHTFQEKNHTTDWNNYPIFRYPDIPEVEVAIIDRPDEPAEGGGELTSMPTSGAAIANAVYQASGKRVYELPISVGKCL